MIDDSKRQLIWNKTESCSSQYYLQYPDGSIAPYHEARASTIKSLTDLRSFFIKNGLVQNKQGDEEDRRYYLDDFSPEGLKMIRRGAEGWADSKAVIKNPPDFKS